MQRSSTPTGAVVHRFGSLRRVLTGAAILAAFLALLAGALHTRWVRSAALARVLARFNADAGVHAQVGRLDYNLFTLGGSLHDVTVAAAGSSTPFFHAEAIHVDLPWAAVRGDVAFESLEVRRPRVTIVREVDGTSNLPQTTDDGGETPMGAIHIGRLVLTGLEMRYDDRALDLDVQASGAGVEMAQDSRGLLSGRLASPVDMGVRLGGRQTRISRFDGGLSFDGSTLTASGLIIESPEASLRFDGGLDLLKDQRLHAARYSGHVALDRASPWASIQPPARGRLAFSGTVAGTLDDPRATIELAADRLAWSGVEASLTANAGLTAAGADIASVTAVLANGEIVGEARVPFTGDVPGRVRLRWRNLDVRELATLPGAEALTRLASTASGAGALEWIGRRVVEGRGSIENMLQPRPRPGGVAVAGRANLELVSGRYEVTHQHRWGEVTLGGNARGRLDATRPAGSTLSGHATLRADDLTSVLRQARDAGSAFGTEGLEKLTAALAADAELAGTFEAPVARGTFEATSLRYGSTPSGGARAHFVASPGGIVVDDLHVALGSNTLQGRAAIDLTANTLRGDLAMDLPRLADLAAEVPERWRPDGAAGISVRLAGSPESPAATIGLTSHGVRVAGQSIERIHTTARLAGGVLIVDRLEIAQPDGRLTGSGRYAFASGRYALDLSGEGLSVVPSETAGLPLDARFDFQLRGNGTSASPHAEGFVDFARVAWEKYELGPSRVGVRADGRTLFVNGRFPGASASIRAQMALADPRTFSAALMVARADLARVVRPGGPAGTHVVESGSLLDRAALTGGVSVDLHASGRLDRLDAASAELYLAFDDLTVNGAKVRLDAPARARYSKRAVAVDPFALRIGDTVLSAAGRLGEAPDSGALEIALTGSLADLVPLLHIVPALEKVEASGAIDLTARAAGTLKAPDVDARLSVASARVTAGTLPPVSDVTLHATLADGTIDVRDARAEWQGAKLTGSAQVPLGLLGDRLPAAYRETLPSSTRPAQATLRIESLTREAIAPFVSPDVAARVAGRVDAVATATARSLSLDGVEASVALERAEIELARVPLRQDAPTRLRLDGGRVEVVDWRWSGAGNRVDVSGGAQFGVGSPRLDVALKAALDLRMLGAFAPDIATSGRAALDVEVTGTAGAPSIDGRLTVREGGVILRDPRLAVTGLDGVVAFARDELQFQDVTAQANGGTVRVSGAVSYPRGQPAAGVVAIEARGMAFELPEHLRSEVDADLQLGLGRQGPSLTGAVTVVRGSYREPVSLAAQFLGGAERRASPQQSEPALADRLSLGVQVRTADRIVIDNNYGRFDLRGNLRVAGTAANPLLTGRLAIEEGGDVFLGGRTYEVVRGTIDFTGGPPTEPVIDLSLQTRVQRYDVTLEVAGTPETIEATLRSPGLSQADVISLLLAGQLADETTLAQTEVARRQLIMLLSGEVLGFAGRAVGLDTVQIARGLGGAASDFDLLATDTDPSARLTISKHLSREVELVFSQSLRDTGDITWIAMYRPVRQVELRGATLDDGSRSYEFRHELNLGGGSDAVARGDPRASATTVRVTAVRVVGTPGFDEREVREQLRLDEGERFDFYRWQQDRDRLERFYHQRGFLEARISARRSETADAVTLEYDITRGPSATLAVEGHDLPANLVDRMKEAWASSVFDGFLLDDLESMARAYLVEDGYLRAEVDAAVVSEEDAAEKAIAVRIVPGARVGAREIAFDGQRRFDAAALEAVVDAADLDTAAWQDAAALRTAIERHYRSHGYLECTVQVGSALFAGERATLPVRIAEGRLFTIAAVTVRGAARRSEADVRGAFGLAPASAYVPADLEAARRRVELGYRRDGYNDVEVSVDTRIDETQAQVDVVLKVDEGRQHVLAGVDVAGANLTSRSLVDRALKLEAGQPATVSDLYRAEKRLYDTGVFRSADIQFVPAQEADAGPTRPVRASVALQELPPYRLRYGLRLSDEVGPVEADAEVRPALVLDLLRRNLFGRAISAGIAGQVEADQRLARGVVALPGLFRLPVTTSFFLTRSRQDFAPEGGTPFVEDESSIAAEQRFNPSARMAVTYGYNFSRTHVFEPEPLPGFPPLELRAKVARLTGTYAWDRRDDRLDAADGWFHSSGVELGTEALGSDLRFVKYLAQQHYYRPVGRGVVFASAFRLGLGHGFDQDLIPSEKFYAGGGTSVRGFAEDGLGEIDFLGDPRGGNSMMLFNQELRFPVFGWVRGLVFLDAGNVFPRAADIAFADLALGAGVGVRIDSPFGLVRTDFGVPLTNRRREPAGRWYFGLGHAF